MSHSLEELAPSAEGVLPTPIPGRLGGLEGLPQELIQTIFLQSSNVNLTQVSKGLREKLDSECLQTQLAIDVLFECEDENHHLPQDSRVRSRASPLASSICTTELLLPC